MGSGEILEPGHPIDRTTGECEQKGPRTISAALQMSYSTSRFNCHFPLLTRRKEKMDPTPQPMGMDHQMALEPIKWARR